LNADRAPQLKAVVMFLRLTKRVIVAFIVSPLMTPLVLSVFDYTEGYYSSFGVYALFAYLAVLLFGLPAFLIYRALGWTNSSLFVLGGGLIGYLVSMFIFEGYRVKEHLWCSVAGSLSALVFRTIVYGLPFKRTKTLSVEGET
jgi:hypothetical protein